MHACIIYLYTDMYASDLTDIRMHRSTFPGYNPLFGDSYILYIVVAITLAAFP